MNNPLFDTSTILPQHVALLREIAAGRVEWRDGVAHLFKRGLVEYKGVHAVQLTGKGQYALRGVFPGAVVQVSNSHKLAFLHGAVGVVESVDARQEDSDSIDDYGYTVKRAKTVTSARIRIADRSGEWIFYNPESLVGLPRLKAQLNEYWKNVC